MVKGGYIMDTTKQVKTAATYAGISLAELSRRTGSSPQAFSQRLKADTLRPADLERIAQAIGAQYKSVFIFPDGKEI